MTSRGTPALLRAFLLYIHSTRDRWGDAETRSVFQHVLDLCATRLGLTTDQLDALGSPQYQYTPTSDLSISDFLALFRCVATFLPEGVDQLLGGSAGSVRDVRPIGGASEAQFRRTSLVRFLLQTVLSTLTAHSVEPTPAIRRFFESALRSPLLCRPVLPRELPGWAHRLRGCGMCAVCGELDEFLASETVTERFFYPGASNVHHLESRVDRKQFSVNTAQPYRRYMTTIKKLKREVDHDRLELGQKMTALRGDLAPLRGEYLQKLFGEEVYRDLVLLESQGDGTGRDGVKRGADDEGIVEAEAKRLRTWALQHSFF